MTPTLHDSDPPLEATPEADSATAAALREALRRYWGYDAFRELQEPAMAAIGGGRDSLVVLPTGGGKSLCYQAPAVALDRLGVVVSPLIALMKDQVDGLVASGVPAVCLHSAQSPAERRAARTSLEAGEVRLVYVSPERLLGNGGDRFRDTLARLGPSYVAVDEAHCISQWGHAFRPEYRQLGELRQLLPGISLHGYTATATPRVRDDIVEQLGLVDPVRLLGSFDRPNLVYRVWRRSDAAAQVKRVVERHRGEGGIVYCISRREVESMAERLRRAGYRAVAYHAGLGDDERATAQDAFVAEEVEIVVATVAFGMGIDRSNVRFVVHVGAPRSLEHYQQEAGRAGRDGLPADCVLVHSPADILKWRHLLRQSGELTPATQGHLRQMERYAGRASCRHAALAAYFGEVLEGACGACDWCLGELKEVEGGGLLARKILSGVARVRQRFGVQHVIDVLRGRDTERVRARGHQELSTYGLLADRPATELRGFVDQLVDAGYLVLTEGQYPVLQLTEAGLELLAGRVDATLFETVRPPRGSRSRSRGGDSGEGWEGVDRALFEVLRQVRTQVARARGVPPYVIFHDRTLRDLARRRPATHDELLSVRGVGERKAADLGELFLAAIAEHAAPATE